MSAEVWELVNLCHGNHCVSFPSSRWMTLNVVLGAAYVSDGALSSLDAKIVEFPVLIKDLPSKVGSFHCFLVPAVCLTRFCPDPYWWTVSAAWKIMEALVFPSTCGAPCCGRSRLGTSPRSAVIMGKHWHFTGLMTLCNMGVWGVADMSPVLFNPTLARIGRP